MCGIVGYANFFKKISLEKGIEAISHRGPDASGAAYFEGLALGNTRLAIIDLSVKGSQPLFSADKSLCITFNGEIYNYKEIRKLLEKKYKFLTHTDTEVILNSYLEWGVKCLEKLSGMFSFVIFDKKKNLLFGSRDRLGQKPLKYYYDNNKFIFASEIKAILSLLDSKTEVDTVAIDNFLTLQYIPSPKTGFKNIYKLPAGHYFIFQNNKLSINRYWSLDFNKKLNLSKDDWYELIFDQMNSSVKSHLVSDVPVGALLSGGLDSSIVVALMSRNSSQRINTFSIGFDDQKFDETIFATQVSKIYNTIHHQLNIKSKDMMENIANLADIFDEPIGDNSILPATIVSKFTSSKVKVALTGDGGDENFAGYERYTFVNLAQFLSKFPPLTKQGFKAAVVTFFKINPTKLSERANRFVLSLNELFYRRYISYNCFFTNQTKQDLYSKDFQRSVDKNDSYEIFKNLYDKKLTDLDNALKIDINTYLPDDLLYKSDSSSMANGLELRSPFLDHLLMEKLAAMPSEMKIKLTTKKKILKDIARKYDLLPADIVQRPKHGFTIPQNKWFKGPLKKYIYNQVLGSKMIGRVFEKNKLEDYLDYYYQTNLNYDNNIFALIMLSLWFNKYH